MKTIRTFAFFDLETTSLPDFDGFTTKITELSIVACPVSHFISAESDKLPRVQHKLTICLNPAKRIDEKASNISGLDNYLLEYENKFTRKTAELIENFFEQLSSPVCLVAHNGLGLDFPLLKKELKAHDIELKSIVCVDSLLAFREIDNQRKTAELAKAEPQLIPADESAEILLEITDPLLESSKIDWQKLNERTPKQQTKVANIRPSKQHSNDTNNTLAGIDGRKRSHPTSSKRSLFPVTFKRGEYTLISIYRRFFGQAPPTSHFAECDVISLMKCAIHEKNDFLLYAERESIKFEDIKRLGVRN